MQTKFVGGYLLQKDKLVKKTFFVFKNKFFLKSQTNKTKVVNIHNKIVAPGFVDLHTHSRVPGSSENLYIKNFAMQAKAGGFTKVVLMANTKPPVITFRDKVKILKKFAKMPNLSVIQACRATNSGSSNICLSPKFKKQIYSDDGSPITNRTLMKKVLVDIKKTNSWLLLHEQNTKYEGCVYNSSFAKANNLKSFSHRYESSLIKRDIKLNKRINAKIHIQHVSTSRGLSYIRKAQNSGMPITLEVTPHHLALNNNELMKLNSNFKVNPPLPKHKWQKKLIRAFSKGIVNIVATDHAPHPPEVKTKTSFQNAAFGMMGMSTAFAVLYTKLVLTKKVTLVNLLRAMSVNPGNLLGINVELRNNIKNNFIIINLSKKWIFNLKILNNTPFLNNKLIGKVEKVFYTK